MIRPRVRVNLSCSVELFNFLEGLAAKCGFGTSCEMTSVLLRNYAMFKSLGREAYLMQPGISVDFCELMESLDEGMKDEAKKIKAKRKRIEANKRAREKAKGTRKPRAKSKKV